MVDTEIPPQKTDLLSAEWLRLAHEFTTDRTARFCHMNFDSGPYTGSCLGLLTCIRSGKLMGVGLERYKARENEDEQRSRGVRSVTAVQRWMLSGDSSERT